MTYVLSESDRVIIQDLIEQVKRFVSAARQLTPQLSPQRYSPQVYLARSLEIIPAATDGLGTGTGTDLGTVDYEPGIGDCQIYRVDDDDGTLESNIVFDFVQPVLNYGDEAIPAYTWLLALQDK